MRNERIDFLPTATLNCLEEVGGMQAHLAFRLPQPRGINQACEERNREDNAEFFAIHE